MRGERLADALEAVTRDASLKEAYFTTPLALATAGQPSKYHKAGGKSRHKSKDVPPPPQARFERPKSAGKGKQPRNLPKGLKLVSTTPDGRQICYAYNNQGCSNKNCPRVHVCRVEGCMGEHPVFEHDAASK